MEREKENFIRKVFRDELNVDSLNRKLLGYLMNFLLLLPINDPNVNLLESDKCSKNRIKNHFHKELLHHNKLEEVRVTYSIEQGLLDKFDRNMVEWIINNITSLFPEDFFKNNTVHILFSDKVKEENDGQGNRVRKGEVIKMGDREFMIIIYDILHILNKVYNIPSPEQIDIRTLLIKEISHELMHVYLDYIRYVLNNNGFSEDDINKLFISYIDALFEYINPNLKNFILDKLGRDSNDNDSTVLDHTIIHIFERYAVFVMGNKGDINIFIIDPREIGLNKNQKDDFQSNTGKIAEVIESFLKGNPSIDLFAAGKSQNIQ